jgi:hypothetical protein
MVPLKRKRNTPNEHARNAAPPVRPWNSTGPNTVVEPRSQVGMGRNLVPPLNIFKIDAEGHPIWMQTAASLEEAKSFVQQLGMIWATEYLVVSLVTGNKISIKPPYQ